MGGGVGRSELDAANEDVKRCWDALMEAQKRASQAERQYIGAKLQARPCLPTPPGPPQLHTGPQPPSGPRHPPSLRAQAARPPGPAHALPGPIRVGQAAMLRRVSGGRGSFPCAAGSRLAGRLVGEHAPLGGRRARPSRPGCADIVG